MTNSCSVFLRNLLTILLKPRTDERHPIFRRDAFEMQHLAKLIERHTTTLKYILHQMLLATKETIRHMLMVLPYTTQSFLHS